MDSGHTLGGLSGLTVSGNNHLGTYGISVVDGASMHISNLAVQAFDDGLDAERKGSLYTNGTISIQEFVDVGVFANDHALISISQAFSLNGFNTGAVGFSCANSSEITAAGCTVSNVGCGFYAELSGYINANGAITSNCPVGFFAQRNGSIDAENSQANNCSTHGWQALSRSFIWYDGSTGNASTFADGSSWIEGA